MACKVAIYKWIKGLRLALETDKGTITIKGFKALQKRNRGLESLQAIS